MTITVKAAGGTDIPDPQVVLDEHPINSASLGVRRAIDPGQHVLRATAEGYKPGELRFTVLEGASADEPLMLDKDLMATPVAAAPGPATAPTTVATSPDLAPAQVSPARKLAPWIAFGVGGAGLVVGGITGLLAMSKHSTLSGECKPNCETATSQSDLSSYHTIGAVSTVGFIVAGLGGAAGAILLITQPKAAPTTGVRVVPVVGLGSVGATGSF